MKKQYLVNKKLRSGKHEVHALHNCERLPEPENREPLGAYDNCQDAVRAAESRGYKPANGCYWCSWPCN